MEMGMASNKTPTQEEYCVAEEEIDNLEGIVTLNQEDINDIMWNSLPEWRKNQLRQDVY